MIEVDYGKISLLKIHALKSYRPKHPPERYFFWTRYNEFNTSLKLKENVHLYVLRYTFFFVTTFYSLNIIGFGWSFLIFKLSFIWLNVLIFYIEMLLYDNSFIRSLWVLDFTPFLCKTLRYISRTTIGNLVHPKHEYRHCSLNIHHILSQ